MKRSGRIFMLLGVVLALVAGLLVFVYLNRLQTQQQAASTQSSAPVEIVVAARDVSGYSVLSQDAFKKEAVSRDTVAEDNLVDPAAAIGKMTTVSLRAGQRVLKSQLVEGTFSSGMKKETGKRAMAVAVDPVAGVAGLIGDGDHVDVLVSLKVPEVASTGAPAGQAAAGAQAKEEPATKATLQDIEVLRAIATGAAPAQGQPAQPGKTAVGSILVLAVTPQEAEVIRFGTENGTIQYLLRAREQRGTEQTTGATTKILTDMYGVPIPEPITRAR